VKYYRSVTPVCSVLLVFCYATFSLLALARYPLHYSPMTNWLSDLGNRALNPAGAVFYNVGIVVTGMLLALFFLGLTVLKIEKNRMQNLMLLAAQSGGMLGSLSMVMSAIFPIDLPTAHSIWSAGLYIATGTGFAFSVAALRYHEKWPRWLLALGVLTALADMVISVFFGAIYVLEWVTVCLFLSYALLVGVETRRLFYNKVSTLIVR
jgi:hypothetical membrane protein